MCHGSWLGLHFEIDLLNWEQHFDLYRQIERRDMQKREDQRHDYERRLKCERNRDGPWPASLPVSIDERLIEHFAGVDSANAGEVPSRLERAAAGNIAHPAISAANGEDRARRGDE